jgi:hypothetical protein
MSTKKRKAKSQKATADSRKGSTCRVSSRRRSLSALAKVYTRVEAMRDKARLLGDDCAKHGRWPSAAVHSARVSALTDVLMILLEVEHEEPEANNQG